ncbi:hypothetical protein LR48_Vigan08g119400 [Vigna angularis]|nr:uncharacterized protein LOC108340165 [Vigna angularis]KOM50367.1 hypothetical protein LR48_Vigan08g119400 [Vigna angularis]BAT90288.1 hypothetical protein VIGAN_06150600 [Vigna angularis var. angularis]
MGNCLRKSKISAQNNEECDASVVEKVEKVKVVRILSKLEAAEMEERMMKKKVMRLMVKNGGSCKSGGVRISVVMSQQELKRMLRCKDEAQQQSSMEEFLHAVKLRGRRILQVGGDCDHDRISSWKPSLDTIPEDCFINSNSTICKQ